MSKVIHYESKGIVCTTPIDVLNNKEIEHCQKLSKNGYSSVIKYLKNAHPKMGLKEAKIYYDLYFNN